MSHLDDRRADRQFRWMLVGWCLGVTLYVAVCVAADHIGHHRDTLGIAAELVLIVPLVGFGALVGYLAGSVRGA